MRRGRRGGVAALLAGMALVGSAPALAQSDATSATAKANQQAVKSGDAVEPEHALGNWGGVRDRLADKGVDLQLGYLAEVADVASGGLRRGADYAHQIKLQADIDGKPLLGVDGLSFHTALINRTGRNASGDFLGDDLFQVQEIYGATGRAPLHLSYLYAEGSLAGGKVDIKGGRLSVGADFATSPLFCQFLSLGLCPEPRALTVEPNFSVVPSAVWAARVRVQPKDVYLAAGVYQARPRYGGPSGFDWGFSGTSGVVVPVEIGWEPRFGSHEVQGHYKAGLVVDTSRFPDLDPTRPSHASRLSWYVLADQMLVRTGDSGTDGLILLGGWSHSDPRTSVMRDFVFGGMVARGVIPGRKGDTVELLVGHGEVSNRLTEAQIAAEESGATLPTGFPPEPGAFGPPAKAPGVQTQETVLEANYGLKLAPGITAVPDVQYVIQPGAAARVPDALVLGGRFELDF